MNVRVAISMGDPTGIGPEIILKALADPLPDVRYLVFGVRSVFEDHGALPREVEWVDVDADCDASRDALRPGHPDALAGGLMVASLEAALDAVIQGRADALCTAPITKAAARAAGFPFPGHTEYLAQRTGSQRFAMMLAGPTLRVVPLTGHLPLREVARHLTAEQVQSGLVVTASALASDFGIASPRVVLAGLNPHAGEGGMLGDEEQHTLAPALEQAREELRGRGLRAEIAGPTPADTLFVPPLRFDAAVCCYHDQALIPLKMLHRDEGVNVTLGLPLVRTSPAHGSALDIAGQGRANPASMKAALALAVELTRRRRAGA
jgi:4-hydroxythreonine-4-phosphate dehydrogenase